MINEIEPIQGFNETATQLRVSDALVNLGTSVNVQWELLDADGKVLKVDRVFIEGEEYAAWGSDDEYLVGVVADKIGAVIVP